MATVIQINEQPRNPVTKVYDTASNPKVVQTGPVASITQEDGVATVTRANHGYANGKAVTISGADQDEYNGAVTVANAATDTFDYTLPDLPVTPATGTITADAVTVDGLTRVGLLANVELTGHGYNTNDEVVIAGADQAAYNGTFVVTVIDADNFTYPLMEAPESPATGTLYVSDEDQSQWVVSPEAIQIESIAGGTTVKLEVAVSLALGWKQLGSDYTSSDNGKIIALDARYNYVRLRRSAGTGAVKAHAQS